MQIPFLNNYYEKNSNYFVKLLESTGFDNTPLQLMVINIKKIQLIEGNIGTNYKGCIEESREYHLNITTSDFLKNTYKV